MTVLHLQHHLDPSYAAIALFALSAAGLRVFFELSRAPSGLIPHILHIVHPRTTLTCTTPDHRLSESTE